MQDTQFRNELIDIDLEGKTLPAVTSADEGKVLTVEGKNVQGSVLVPEETFVFTDGIMTEINMQNKSLFVEGAECLLTVNGTTSTATVQTVSEPDSGLKVQDNVIGITILLEDGTNVSKLYVPNIGTYTVSLYIEGTEYVWAAADGGENSSLLLTYTYDGSGFSCDKTPSEILTAINNKKQILSCLGEGRPIMVPYVELVMSGDDEISGIDITFFQYSFETVESEINLEIEGMQLNHDIESGSVTLKTGGTWKLTAEE